MYGSGGGPPFQQSSVPSMGARSSIAISSLSSGHQPGHLDALVKTLCDMSQRDDMKLKALQEISLILDEIPNGPAHALIGENLLRAFLKLFKETTPQCVAENNTQQLRKLILETILRMSFSEPMKAFAKHMELELIRCILTENEENAVVALKILMEHIKHYRLPFVSEITNLMNHFKMMYRDMVHHCSLGSMFTTRRQVLPQWNFEDNTLENTLQQCFCVTTVHVDNSEGQERQVAYTLIPRGSQSVKLLSEVPSLIILLCNMYKQQVLSDLGDLTQILTSYLSARVPPSVKLEPGYNREVNDEFLNSQVRAFTFLAFYAKASAAGTAGSATEFFQNNASQVISSMIALFETTPNEPIVPRRELLVAARYFFNSEHQIYLVNMLPRLLNNNILLGDGVSVNEVLRVSVVQMMCDLCHHLRNHLSFDVLVNSVYYLSLMIHTSQIHSHSQAMCCKALMNLVEAFANLEKNHNEPCRDVLLHMLDIYVRKFQFLAKNHVQPLLRRYTLPARRSRPPSDTQVPVVVDSSVESIVQTDSPCKSESLPYSLDGSAAVSSYGTTPDLAETTDMQPSSSVSAEPTANEPSAHTATIEECTPRFAVPSLPPPTKTPKSGERFLTVPQLCAMYNYYPPMPTNPADARGMVRILMQSIKVIAVGISHSHITSDPPFSSERERALINKLFRDGIRCLEVYSIVQMPNAPPGVMHRVQSRSGVRARDEKEALDYFTATFTLMNVDVFEAVFMKNVEFLFESMLQDNALQFIVNGFLISPNVSAIVGREVLKYLLSRLGDLSEVNERSSMYLKVFKMVFSSVSASNPTATPDNEIMLRNALHQIVYLSIKYALRAPDPTQYFLLLRSLFRSIGNGSHEQLYQSFLPLLPSLLEQMCRIHSGRHRQSVRELFCELCLTVPVRLSSLLPYLPLLMDPLVYAFSGSTSLVQQGLRTLELCVDNLQPEYLYYYMAPVRSPLMQGIWRVIRHSTDPNCNTVALRIIGKLGGLNRKFLLEAPHLEYSVLNEDDTDPAILMKFRRSVENMDTDSREGDVDEMSPGQSDEEPIECKVDLYDSVVVALDQLRTTLSGDVESNRGNVLRTVTHKMSSLLVRQHSMSLCRGVLMLALRTSKLKNTDLIGEIMKQINETEASSFPIPSLDVPFRSTNTKAREMYTKALTAIIMCVASRDLQEQVLPFFYLIVRFLSVLLVLERRDRIRSDFEQRCCLDGMILVDAIAEVLADAHLEFTKPAVVALEVLHETALQFSKSEAVATKLPFYGYVMESMVGLCYETQWYARHGGCCALLQIIATYPLAVIHEHVVQIISGIIEVFFGLNDEVSFGTIEMARKAMRALLIRCFSGQTFEDEQSSFDGLSAKQYTIAASVINRLLEHLADPITFVRVQVVEILEEMAEITNSSVSLLLQIQTDRLRQVLQRGSQLFMTMSACYQVGFLEAYAYVYTQKEPVLEFDFNDNVHERFLKNLILLCEADEDILEKLPNYSTGVPSLEHPYSNSYDRLMPLKLASIKAAIGGYVAVCLAKRKLKKEFEERNEKKCQSQLEEDTEMREDENEEEMEDEEGMEEGKADEEEETDEDEGGDDEELGTKRRRLSGIDEITVTDKTAQDARAAVGIFGKKKKQSKAPVQAQRVESPSFEPPMSLNSKSTASSSSTTCSSSSDSRDEMEPIAEQSTKKRILEPEDLVKSLNHFVLVDGIPYTTKEERMRVDRRIEAHLQLLQIVFKTAVYGHPKLQDAAYEQAMNVLEYCPEGRHLIHREMQLISKDFTEEPNLQDTLMKRIVYVHNLSQGFATEIYFNVCFNEFLQFARKPHEEKLKMEFIGCSYLLDLLCRSESQDPLRWISVLVPLVATSDAELAMPGVDWRPKLRSYLNKHANHAITFLLNEENVLNEPIWRLFVAFMKDESSLPLRMVFINDTALLSRLLSEESKGEWVRRTDHGMPMKYELATLSILWVVVKNHQEWWAGSEELVASVRKLWSDPAFVHRYSMKHHPRLESEKDKPIVDYVDETKFRVPKIVVSLLLVYYRNNIDDIPLLCEIINLFAHKFISDFVFFRQYISEHIIPTFPLYWRRSTFFHVVEQFSENPKAAAVNNELARFMQYIVVPCFAYAFERYDADEVIGAGPNPDEIDDNNIISVLVRKIIDVCRMDMCDSMLIGMYQFCILLVQHCPHHIHEYNHKLKQVGRLRIFMVFAWPCLQAQGPSDITVKYTGHLLIAHIIDKFAINRKIVLQVHGGLMKAFAQDNREIIKKALDVITPALPKRMDDGYLQLLTFMKKVISEEAHNIPQMAHCMGSVCRHYKVYYYVRHHLLPFLVHGMQRMILTNHTLDSRKLVVDVCETIIKWELLRGKLVEQQNVPTEEMEIDLTRDTTNADHEMCARIRSYSPHRSFTGTMIPTTSSLAAGGNEEIHRPLERHFADQTLNMLIRVVTQTGEQLALQTQPPNQATQAADALNKRTLMLLKAALKPEVWGLTANINNVSYEKLLLAHDNPSPSPQQIVQSQVGVEVLSSLVAIIPRQMVANVVQPLQRALAICVTSNQASILRALYELLKRLMERTKCTKTGLVELDVLNKGLIRFINDSCIAFERSSPSVLQTVVAPLHMLKLMTTNNEGFLETMCFAPFMKMFHKMVKDHVDGLVPKQSGSSISSGRSGGEPREYMTAETCCIAMELLCTQLARMSVETRKNLCRAVLIVMIERGVCDKILAILVKIADQFLKFRDDSAYKCGLPILCQMLKYLEDRILANRELLQSFLYSVVVVYENPDLRSCDVIRRLDTAFYWGVCCNDEDLRGRFMAVWDQRMSPFLFDRIQYLLSEQDWTPLIQHFWVKHCLHLCMFTLNGVKRAGSSEANIRNGLKRHFNTALRSDLTDSCTLYDTLACAVGKDLSLIAEEVPSEDIDSSKVLPEDRAYSLPICNSLQSVLTDYESSTTAFMKLRDGPTFQGKDSRNQVSLDRTLRELVHLLNVSSQFRFEDMVSDFLELTYNDSFLASSSWIKMFTSMWSSFNHEERLKIGPLSSQFLASGSHAVQKDCEISVIRCFLDAFLKFSPRLNMPNQLISYLASSHNDWHRSLLHFEEEMCRLGKTSLLHAHMAPETGSVLRQIELYDALRIIYQKLNEQDQLEMIWERRSFFEDTSRLIQLKNLGDVALAKIETQELIQKWKSSENQYAHFSFGSYPLAVRQEVRQWSDNWIESLKSLGEWSSTFDYANRENAFNPTLYVEAAVQLSEWTLAKDCIDMFGGSVPEDEMPMYSIYNAMANITACDKYDDGTRAEVELIEKEASLYILQAWRQLPSVVSHSHMNLLRQAQLLQECHEGSVIARNLTMLKNGRQSADVRERIGDGTQQAIEIKALVKTWRNRQLSLIDDLGASTEIVTWRLFHFDRIEQEGRERLEIDHERKYAERLEKQKPKELDQEASTLSDPNMEKETDEDEDMDVDVDEESNYDRSSTDQDVYGHGRAMGLAASSSTHSFTISSPASASPSPSSNGSRQTAKIGSQPQVEPLVITPALEDLFAQNLNTYSQTVLGLAKVFRQSNQYAQALKHLNMLHTLPQVMRTDASAKCAEHLKTLLKMGSTRSIVIKALSETHFTEGDNHLLEALSLLQTTTLDQMTAEENSRIFSLNGAVLSKLDKDDEAAKTFITAGKVYNQSTSFTCNYVWKCWGDHLEKMYDRDPNDEKSGIQAMHCFLNCARVETRSRKYIAKLLWLLKRMTLTCSSEAISKMEGIVKSSVECVPSANWIIWLNELINLSKQKGASSLALQLLTHIVKNNPEPLFYILRKSLSGEVVSRRIEKRYPKTLDVQKGKKHDDEQVIDFLKMKTWQERLLAILELTVKSRPCDIGCLNDVLDGLESFSVGWYERQIEALTRIKTLCYKDVFGNQGALRTKTPNDELRGAVDAWAHESQDTSVRIEHEDLNQIADLVKHFVVVCSDVMTGKLTTLGLLEMVISFLETVQEGVKRSIRPVTLIHKESYFLSSFSTKIAYIDIFGCVMTTKQQQAQYTEKISRFMPHYKTIYQNGKVYRLVSVLSECGKTYTYSLEQRKCTNGHSPNNQDTVYRLFGLLNSYISRDHECSRRFLLFNQPTVLPIGARTSLVEYAPFGPTYPQPSGNSKLVRYMDIFMDCLNEKRDNETPDRIILDLYKEISALGGEPSAQFLEASFDHIVNGSGNVNPIVPGCMMTCWMSRCYTSATNQWIARKQTACFLGMYFISEFMFHLSPMDLESMVLNVFTGQTAAMEYAFDMRYEAGKGVHLATDKMPFRLSPNLADFIGASVDGHMKNAMIALARCFESHDTVTLLRPLIHDLYYDVLMNNKSEVGEAIPATIRTGDAILSRIRGAATLASGQNTVAYMIYEAGKQQHLCKLDPSLHPWF